MKTISRFLASIPLALFLPFESFLYGQTPTPSPTLPDNIYELKEVVVYGEKAGGDVLEGAALDSLESDGRLGDLLDQIPSVESQGLGGAKSFGNPSIRGAAAEQTVILLNGQRVNQGFDLGNIPTDNIERIEVIKGPAALAYGSDATGGVINIITKTGGQEGLIGASYGGFETYQLRGSTGTWKTGPWEASFGGNWYQTDGYTINTDQKSWELDHASSFRLGQGRLTLSAQYTNRDGGAPNGDSLSAQDIGEFDTDDRGQKRTFNAVIGDQLRLGDWTLDSSLSYNHTYAYRLSPLAADNADGVPLVDLNNYDTYDGWSSASAKWKGLLSALTLGLEFRSEQIQGIEGLDGAGIRENNVGSIFARGTISLNPGLSIKWSGRLDGYADYNTVVFNPSGTLRYDLEPGRSVYLESGTGYRRPDFDELYHPLIPYVTPGPVEFGSGETGNPALQPESSINWEAGTDLVWNQLILKVDGFADFYSNLIVPAQNTTGYWTFENIAQARLFGAEADLRWSPAPWFSPYGNLLYVDSRDTETNQPIAMRMKEKFTGGIRSDIFPGAELNLYTQYVEHNPALYQGAYDEEAPIITLTSYWIWNAEFKLKVGKSLKIFLNGTNLLNSYFATLQGLPMPGRYLEAGTTWSF